MKVAILISGEPRFCTDFDQFMNSLTNYSRIDYYFYLWKDSPIDLSNKKWNLVADSWRSINDINWAKGKIQQNITLPNHYLEKIELGNQNINDIPIIKEKAKETNVYNVWHMHKAWIKVNELKNSTQLEKNFKYDLVINARLDIKINPLDLEEIFIELKNTSPSLITVNSPCYGYGSIKINDQFTIGLESTMNTYMNVGYHTLDYNNEGVLFHPETLLSYHLQKNQIKIIKKDFDLKLRNGWKKGDPFYTSDFGLWK